MTHSPTLTRAFGRIHPYAVIAFATVLFAGCAEGGSSTTQTIVRDSAGIQIVENADADPPGDLTWAVAAEPLLQIGTIDGPAAYQLSRVRGVRRLSDGRIVIADGASRELRVYDDEGTHIQSMGGAGSGPGEFQELAGILAFGDSIVAYDWRQQRITVFGADGELRSTGPIELAEESRTGGIFIASPAGTIEGDVVLIPNGGAYPSMGPESLVWQDFGRGYRFDRAGTASEMVGEPLGAAFFISPEFSMPAPFGRRTVFSFGNERLYLADGGSYEVRVFERGTTPVRVVRLSRAPQPVTPEMIDRFLEDRLSGVPEDSRPDARRRYSILEYPPHLPSIRALEVDDLDNLWVADYVAPWAAGNGSWNVFDSEGRLLGLVALPIQLRVEQVGVDFILGIWTDELGVEYVRMYALERG